MSSLILRKANNEDINLLFDWANDDTVRNNSFNAEKILGIMGLIEIKKKSFK